MKTWIAGAAFAALSAAVAAQAPAGPPADTKWGFFTPEGGTLQAGVVAADGSQLILKCDKPGRRRVYAVVLATNSLAAPLPDNQFESFSVTVRIDQKPPFEDNWRFNDRFAMAMDQGNVRALTRLLGQLHDASTIELRFKPLNGSLTVVNFEVTGARDAIERVYASCDDTVPFS